MEPIGGKEMAQKIKTFPFTRADGRVVRVTIPCRDEDEHRGLSPADDGIRAAIRDASPMPAAREKFLDEAVEVGAILGAMAAELKRVGACSEAKPRDYGFAGSMGHVRAELSELLANLRGIK
jgi:hypothetical protein